MFPYSLTQLEPALKNYFDRNDDEKNHPHQRVQPEKGDVNPVQAAPPRNPVLHHETGDDDKPAEQIRDAKTTKKSEAEQQPAHHHVREKRRAQRVLRPP